METFHGRGAVRQAVQHSPDAGAMITPARQGVPGATSVGNGAQDELDESADRADAGPSGAAPAGRSLPPVTATLASVDPQSLVLDPPRSDLVSASLTSRREIDGAGDSDPGAPHNEGTGAAYACDEAGEHDISLVGAWTITTESGSVYRVGCDAGGRWWLEGENAPNPRSVALPRDRAWLIEPPSPWPPVCGVPLVLRAARHLALDDPRRAPRGGKVTAPVQRVRRLPVADG